MPSNSYYYGSNRTSNLLNLKAPVRVRPDLTPKYLRKRIPEILGNEYGDLCLDFYNSLYHHFFSAVGYPVKQVHPLGTNHETLDLCDAITIEEVANYSRLYQKAPTSTGFLILEQALDTVSNPEVNVWKTIIKTHPHKMEVYYKDCSAEGVLNLEDLKKEDEHLYHHFKEFIDTHKQIFAECLMDKLPQDKATVIRESNPDTTGMIQALWEDFLIIV